MICITKRIMVRSAIIMTTVLFLLAIPTAVAGPPTATCVTGLTLTENSDGSILVEWDAVPGATEYQVLRGTEGIAGTFDGFILSPLNANYLDTDTKPGVTYDYFVSANGFAICPTVQITTVPFFSSGLLSAVAIGGSLLAYVGIRRMRK